MKLLINTFSFLLILFFITILPCQAQDESDGYAIVVHGGSGNISENDLPPQLQGLYHEALDEALSAAQQILENGGTSLDAVEQAIWVLEDNSLFNAGKGAVFNIDGNNELDASFMCGKTHNAGAVTAVTTIKNPVSAARKVMEVSPHVFLSGKGAEIFAFEQGLEIVDPGYFFDQKRWDQYQDYIRKKVDQQGYEPFNTPGFVFGTVGAVAIDVHGNIAAATSTGGMTGKQYGRIGDSPVIGAGTYADNQSCGVSATGHGEFFIRNVVGHDIAARVKYGNQSLQEASSIVIHDIIRGKHDANGGIIAIDKAGNIVMEFNTTVMFRGFINKEGEKETAIFK